MEPLPFTAPTTVQRQVHHHNRSLRGSGGWWCSEGRSLAWVRRPPPATSITRALWHALHGDFYGRTYSLSEAVEAGFNTCACTTYQGTMTVPEVVAAGEEAGVYVIPILREAFPQIEDIIAYDGREVVRAWYVYDEPSLAQLSVFEARRRTWNVSKPLFMAAARASYEEFRDRWLRCVSESEIVCHSNHFYQYNTYPRAWCFDVPSVSRPDRYASPAATWLHRNSTHGVNLRLGQEVAERDYKEHWFIGQAHGKVYYDAGQGVWKGGGSDPCQPYDFPTRAQVFFALVCGCTGYAAFAYDSWYLRQRQVSAAGRISAQYGIASDPPLDYGQEGGIVSEAQQAHMAELWTVWAEINAQVAAMEDVLLSRTSVLDYEIEFQNMTYTWADDPIQAICKEYGGEYWFIVVNIENFPHPVRLRLPFAPSSVSKHYGPGVTHTLGGNTISMTMPGWGVWCGKVKP